ncbi:hypothetical protein DFH06DRAFT_1149043 [Mycena polygramma]|nr:hypothetical protein DFH06DRAFT_1149043 [Mycena polygramma]
MNGQETRSFEWGGNEIARGKAYFQPSSPSIRPPPLLRRHCGDVPVWITSKTCPCRRHAVAHARFYEGGTRGRGGGGRIPGAALSDSKPRKQHKGGRGRLHIASGEWHGAGEVHGGGVARETGEGERCACLRKFPHDYLARIRVAKSAVSTGRAGKLRIATCQAAPVADGRDKVIWWGVIRRQRHSQNPHCPTKSASCARPRAVDDEGGGGCERVVGDAREGRYTVGGRRGRRPEGTARPFTPTPWSQRRSHTQDSRWVYDRAGDGYREKIDRDAPSQPIKGQEVQHDRAAVKAKGLKGVDRVGCCENRKPKIAEAYRIQPDSASPPIRRKRQLRVASSNHKILCRSDSPNFDFRLIMLQFYKLPSRLQKVGVNAKTGACEYPGVSHGL